MTGSFKRRISAGTEEMRHPAKMLGLVAALSCAVPNDDASAQTKLPPGIAREISNARRNDNVAVFSRILSQADSAISESVLDALADTLVAIVNSDSGASRRLRYTAIDALILSGIPDAKRVYSGVGSRLFAIASSAPDAGDRGAALSGLTSMADKAFAVKLLHDVALVNNSVAAGAIRVLRTAFRSDGGEDALRDLYKRGTVTDETARVALLDFAQRQGWK